MKTEKNKYKNELLNEIFSKISDKYNQFLEIRDLIEADREFEKR